MQYRCGCGKVSQINFADFRNGRRCGCGFIRSAVERSCGIHEATRVFAEHGCELLDSVYMNSHIPMSYRCSCGRISKISLSALKTGRRCKECGRLKNCGENNPRWVADKTQSILNTKIRRRYKTLVWQCLRYMGLKKDSKSEKLLGYPSKALREIIFNHPNWNMVKDGRWHVDHIFPIKAFMDYGITDLKIINALDNLRPISEKENLMKGRKYNKKEFQEWLKTKGIAVGGT